MECDGCKGCVHGGMQCGKACDTGMAETAGSLHGGGCGASDGAREERICVG